MLWVVVPDFCADMKQCIIPLQLFLPWLLSSMLLSEYSLKWIWFPYFTFKLPEEKPFQLVNLFFIFSLLCTKECMMEGTHTTAHVWQSLDNLVEIVALFHIYMDGRDQTWVTRSMWHVPLPTETSGQSSVS